MEGRPIELYVVTKNYEAMKQFFIDLGLDVPKQDYGWQLNPVFNEGRTCVIWLGPLVLNLEESTHSPPSGPLYLDVGEIGVARLLSLMTKYTVTDQGGGACFHVVPPDGGVVAFTAVKGSVRNGT
jgi:hypothetical protein